MIHKKVTEMKKIRNVILIITFSLLFLIPMGCGKKTESWAYSHEPGEETIAFYSNGKAVYKGTEYNCKKDDTFITLTGKDKEEIKLRYEMNGDSMILYEKSTYKYDGSKDGDGIVGTWKQDNGWSYVFTNEGEFSEENIFFGHYSVDEEKSCIKLMYNDPIDDAYLYYTLNGDELTIDYPWPMTRTLQN